MSEVEDTDSELMQISWYEQYHNIAPPRFHRHLVWTDTNSITTSPSALYTETAPPFNPPPIHLTKHPDIQASLDAMRDAIKVDTPFNIDKFEALLEDHPNQPFV